MMRTDARDERSRPERDAAETTLSGACLERAPSCRRSFSALMGPRSWWMSLSEMEPTPGRSNTTLKGVRSGAQLSVVAKYFVKWKGSLPPWQTPFVWRKATALASWRHTWCRFVESRASLAWVEASFGPRNGKTRQRWLPLGPDTVNESSRVTMFGWPPDVSNWPRCWSTLAS
jgi:hypothetical protein